jgi:hypothetical protein
MTNTPLLRYNTAQAPESAHATFGGVCLVARFCGFRGQSVIESHADQAKNGSQNPDKSVNVRRNFTAQPSLVLGLQPVRANERRSL